MDAIQVLHNAARHYCMDQTARWHRQYAELTASGRQRTSSRAGAWDYTAEAYNVFPRYNVLDAIRRDVERFVPGDFGSVDELKSTLLAAGETAIVPGPPFDGPVATRAADDERRRFAEFVRTADEHELSALPALPFRRVLGEAEHRTLHAAFVDRWGVWYGGSVDPAEAEAGTVTLHEIAMDDPGAYDCLRHLGGSRRHAPARTEGMGRRLRDGRGRRVVHLQRRRGVLDAGRHGMDGLRVTRVVDHLRWRVAGRRHAAVPAAV
jgi:hypothetical protein